jgi:hypothetical protein
VTLPSSFRKPSVARLSAIHNPEPGRTVAATFSENAVVTDSGFADMVRAPE